MKRIFMILLGVFALSTMGFGQVLFDQLTGQTNTGGRPAQLFPDFGYCALETADDFTVPSGQTWNIDTVSVYGTFSSGGGSNFDTVVVTFYNNNAGVPGTIITRDTVALDSSNTDNFVDIDLNSTVTLAAGTYWITANVIMDFNGGAAPGGQWFQGSYAATAGNEWHIQDPCDLLGSGTTTWSSATTQGASDNAMMFRLAQKVTSSVSCDSSTISATGSSVVGDTARICLQAGKSDTIMLNHTPTSNNYAYFVVTSTDTVVFQVPGNTAIVDTSAEPGIYKVYGIDYSGNLTLTPGMPLSSVMADSCFQLSTNYLVAILGKAEGGMVNTGGVDTVTVCQADANTNVTFANNSTSSYSYSYVVTDASDNITMSSSSATIDFGSATAGTYRVYGVSHKEAITATNGMSISSGISSSDCFQTSMNFVTVTVLDSNSCTAGIEALFGSNDVAIYPNPTSGTLNIAVSSNAVSSYTVEIMDIVGKTVYTSKFAQSTNTISVDGFESGVYFVKVSEGNTSVTKKLIIK